MNRQEHLLNVAAEECVEVAQRCIKAARFGLYQVQKPAEVGVEPSGSSTNPYGLTNKDRIREEYLQLIAVMEMLDIPVYAHYTDELSIQSKKEKVEKYLILSQKLGTLDG